MELTRIKFRSRRRVRPAMVPEDETVLCHGVLLVFGAPYQHSLLAGREHGRTIPLAEVGPGEWRA